MHKPLLATAALMGAFAALAIAAWAAPTRDGAVIRTSRSTNTAAYEIKVWSDGRAQLIQTEGPTSFNIAPGLAKRFFADAAAGRANPGTPGHCMKSASFGTTTVVTWHRWTSSDLQCPPFSAPVTALAADVRAIQAAVKIGGPLHRIPLPREPRMTPRMNPTPSPEVSPT